MSPDLSPIQRLRHWLWHAQPPHRIGRLLQRSGRVLHYLFQALSGGQVQLNAMSLSYVTLLSLVPLLAVSFSVLKAFGSGQVIQPFLTTLLEPLGSSGAELTTRVLEFVDNIKVGVLGTVGIALLFYTAVTLMQKIESVFNSIWQVQELRPLVTRLPMYLSVLLVGPVLVLAATGVTASIFSAHWIRDITHHALMIDLLAAFGWLPPLLLWIGVFAFIYAFIPNTRVQRSAALIGALVASVLWNGVGLAFGTMIAGATSYTAIYSAFASLVLFMVWLQLAWLIVLVGAIVTYAWQHSAHLADTLSDTPQHAHCLQDFARTLAILDYLYECFEQGQPAPDLNQITRRIQTQIPASELQIGQSLQQLTAAGIIYSVAPQPGRLGFIPAHSAEHTNLADLRTALWGALPALDAPGGWLAAWQRAEQDYQRRLSQPHRPEHAPANITETPISEGDASRPSHPSATRD
ncbi:YihY/virulence factor BrkB family protein [Halothiobacillus sp. DCM-1]|uniref:YihY/virulence factor BrkB family protein n=1 Tax=Halothiobacillus sp. DCM-1 TaxID=3112558 RepID=UPI00324B8D71